MEHLSNSEILSFIAISTFDDESKALTSRVNKHILSCRACAEKLRAAVIFDDAVKAMSEPDFDMSMLGKTEYDVSPETVKEAAKELSGQMGSYNY